MRDTMTYPPEQSSSPSYGIPCSHKRGNDGQVSGITVSPGMEEMPSLNMPVQRLKVPYHWTYPALGNF